MNKVYPSAAKALEGVVKDGQLLGVGGFGLCGIPEALIEALKESGKQNLTAISNNAGVDDFGLGKLLRTRQVKKMISSYVGENKEFERQYLAGELAVEFTPQGTLAEKLRAGGSGIPAFFTKTGVGTSVADGKELREFDGETYVMERALMPDVSLVKAQIADKSGNLRFNLTARNFNPAVAMAGKICIVEVEQIVEVGELALEFTPQGTLAEKLRAGGAGIPAFFTKTGVGTQVAEGKELREFDGETYVMEKSLVPDVSLVKAHVADKSGNLRFNLTARNFNPAAAMAGKICIVEVEMIVEVGELAPDDIHLPGIYVHRIVLNANPEKRIEKRTITEKAGV